MGVSLLRHSFPRGGLVASWREHRPVEGAEILYNPLSRALRLLLNILSQEFATEVGRKGGRSAESLEVLECSGNNALFSTFGHSCQTTDLKKKSIFLNCARISSIRLIVWGNARGASLRLRWIQERTRGKFW